MVHRDDVPRRQPASGSGQPRRTTITDVARLAGVSTGSVSYTMNGRPGVSEQTRERIWQAARELGWEPSSHARALLHKRVFAVGLVVTAPHLLEANDSFSPFLSGLERVLSAHDYALLLQVVEPGQAEVRAYRRMTQQHQVDGVVLYDPRRDDPRPQVVASARVPAVAVGSLSSGQLPFPAVDTEHANGIRLAVEHLVGLRHRTIGFIGGPAELEWVVARKRAWHDSGSAAGLDTTLCEHAPVSSAGGAEATTRMVAARQRPTAIVYACDLMALAGLGALQRLGFSVPDDISLVGFDDVPLAQHTNPPLTSVQVDHERLGSHAAQILLAGIDGQPPPRLAPIPVHLLLRKSTGAPGRS